MGKKELSEKEQLELFEQFGLSFLIDAYINQGLSFCDAAQLKFLSLPAPLSEKHVLIYLEHGYQLCEAAEVKLFEMPSGLSLLEYYCFGQNHPLQRQGQLKLLDVSREHRDLVERYISIYQNTPYLCADFVEKARKLGLMKENQEKRQL